MIERTPAPSRHWVLWTTTSHKPGAGRGAEDMQRQGDKQKGGQDRFEELHTKIGLVDISLHVYFL